MKNVFGKKLGQYILLDHLGEGGMARVYNALDARIERNVAIKVILPSKHSSEVFQEQFEREARALANLVHTNIVKVLDYGMEAGQPYLVMEYVGGGTLKQAVQEPLHWQKAAEILAPIARALDYVHSQKIVHRDVKPSNILLDDDDHPMLSDFGVVKLIEAEEEQDNPAIGVGVGTPDYMSPEQGMGREIDFRADIYSLGIVFYELITGTKPFTADTPMAVIIKHTTDEFPAPRKVNRNIPRMVEQAVLRAVQKDPQKRYASMGEFAQALEWIALGEQAPHKKLRKLVRPLRRERHPARWMAWPAVLLLSLLLGTLFVSDALPGPLAGAAAWQTANPCGVVPCTPTQPRASLPTATLPAPTSTAAAAQPTSTQPPASPAALVNLSSLSLLGTPLPTTLTSGAREIARWGIGGINQVTWSPDGSLIALGTTNGVYLYDSQTYARRLFIDTGFNVLKVTFSPDGSSITAGGRNGQVKAWDAAGGKLVQEYVYQRPKSDRIRSISAVSALSYSPDGKNLAVGFENGAVNYFSVSSRTPVFAVEQVPEVKDLVVSADGKTLYVANGSSSILLWDVGGRKSMTALISKAPVARLRFSPDRKYLLTSGEDSPNVYLWDISKDHATSGFPNLGANVTDFDFSHDNQWIAISLGNGEVKVFENPEITKTTQVPAPKQVIQKGYQAGILSLAFSPVSQVFATGNWEEGLKVWDALTGAKVAALPESLPRIERMYLSSDAKWLATAHTDRIVRVWSLSTAREAYQLEGYLPRGLPLSPNNRYLVTIHPAENPYAPELMRVVDLASGSMVADLPGYLPDAFVQFSADSKLMMMGNPRAATIWDVSTWEKLTLRGGPSGSCGLFYTPQDSLSLVTISEAGIFSDSSNFLKNTICGAIPRGTRLMYYFESSRKACFVLGNGNVWFFDKYDANRVTSGSTYPLPDDIFIAGYQEGGLYAAAVNDQLQVHGDNGLRVNIPGQDDYQYRVAFAPGWTRFFALGSRYGSIHIWTLP